MQNNKKIFFEVMTMRFPIALQLYSVRDAMEQDVAATLRAVKDMGYDGVEFAGLFDKNAQEIKALVKELELVPISAHVPYDEMLKDPAGVLETYREIGCPYAAVPYLTEECRPGTPGFADTVKGIETIGTAAKACGIQLLYHNHDFEFVKIDGKYALDVLYATLPPEILMTEIDTCWVNVAGEDPAKYIEKYAGRAPVVHLKDFFMKEGAKAGQLYKLIGIESEEEAASEETFGFRPVGYGMQDFPTILAACEKAQTKWVVVEQDEPALGKSPLECAKMSIDYVKSIMK